jgi:uridine kinase
LVAHLKSLRTENNTNPFILLSLITEQKTPLLPTPEKKVMIRRILILANPELRDLFDVKIYVHADSDERLIRRMKRDIADRGRNMDEVLNRYQNTLKPMHQQFIEPKAFADIIIPNDRQYGCH